MPELPEVETVRRSLLPYLQGVAVRSVTVRPCRIFRDGFDGTLSEVLTGRVFTGLSRHGKWLFLETDGGTVCVHLGMTGQLTVRDRLRVDRPFHRHLKTGLERTIQHPPDRHTHMLAELETGAVLMYRDVRKFGRILWSGLEAGPALRERLGLGIDPLTEEFTVEALRRGLESRRRDLKSVLLDQKFLAGLGNIYVDEALFLAGLRPGRGAYRVKGAALGSLHRAVRTALYKGIEAGGTTLRDFVSGEGQQGYNQEGLSVYGRYGEPCPGCGETLRRGLYGGRTTTWCARCQK